MGYERITPERLADLAARCAMTIAPNDKPAYLELAHFVGEVIDALDALPEVPASNPDVHRGPARPATAEQDPYNAIASLCSVGGDRQGLLAGRRIVVKDAMSIAGVPLTAGSELLGPYVSTEDSEVVARILRSGGEIVATTNMDAFGMSGGGESCVRGPVRCPHDPLRSAGGSSGGSAAALYYDGVDGALGADQGGSIRVPSAWCGVIGLKPTHGLVPYSGAISLDHTLDHVGPMARNVDMVARLLQSVAGRDGVDARQIQVPEALPDYLAAVADAPRDLSGVRIGIIGESLDPATGIDGPTTEAVTRAAEKLSRLGAHVTPISLPEHAQAGPIVFATTLCGIGAALGQGGTGYPVDGRYVVGLADAFADGLTQRADLLSHQTRLGILYGSHLHLRHHGRPYAKARRLHGWLRAAYDTAFSGSDFLLMPTVPYLPFLLADELPLTERVLRGWGVLGNTMASDVTGHPAISLPLEQADGLPVGMMLVARHFSEARLLGAARTIERSIGWAPGDPPVRPRGPFRAA